MFSSSGLPTSLGRKFFRYASAYGRGYFCSHFHRFAELHSHCVGFWRSLDDICHSKKTDERCRNSGNDSRSKNICRVYLNHRRSLPVTRTILRFHQCWQATHSTSKVVHSHYGDHRRGFDFPGRGAHTKVPGGRPVKIDGELGSHRSGP